MKKLLRYLLLVSSICALKTNIWAQCPPAGFPQPGNTCAQAPILCPNLDGYCATINNANTSQNFPGCPGWALNNDEWFAFFAGSTTISITVTPSNCSPGSNQGLQGGIYRSCVSNPVDLQCSCTTSPFELTGSNFVIGQIYYIVLDGCSGNVCDYSIDVTQGSTVSVPPGMADPITGPLSICAGSSGSYSIPPVPVATSYTWTLNPPVGTVSGTGTNVTVNIPANATTQNTQLCVMPGNACYPTNPTTCIDIEVIPRPTATLSGSGSLCTGATGNVDLTVTFTGDGPWTFTPTFNGAPQTPITTSDNPYTLTVTQIGTYGIQTLTATSSNCTGTTTGTAAVTPITVNASATQVGSTCALDNGSIDLSVSGGMAPYTYIWSNGETTQDLSMVAGPMAYTVTVTSAEGCTRTTVVNLANTNPPITLTPVITANTTCNGGNGAITVNASPAGTYTYTWDNGETTNALTNLTPGSYSITVSAGGQCTQTGTFVVPNTPNNPSASLTTTATTCELPNGAVNLSVSGGVAPYTFEWASGQTTEDLSMVEAGPYAVTVTGANGCTTSTSVNLSNSNPPFTVNQNIVANTTCNGGNGSVTLTPAPAGTYTYVWDSGETTNSLTGLTPGTYVATVSAGGACTAVATVNIPDQPNLPSATATVTGSTCELSNGSISVSASGGVAPYTFAWGGGETTQNLSNVPAGTYELTVTGANGCTRTLVATVNNTNPPITITPTVVNNTTCIGGNGSISLSVTPPFAGYTYSWDNGASTPSITNLEPGTYVVTVQGAGACSQTASITINDNPNLPNATTNSTQSICELPNGTAVVNASGGVAPYTYQWDNGATTQSITGLNEGSYEVTVTGANGCTRTAIANVNNLNPNFNINNNVVNNTNCNGSPNGAISVSVTPANTYTYTWSTGATTTGLTGLAAGTYTVTVSAGGACTEELSIDVLDEPSEPFLDYTVINARCGVANGSINLSVSGGQPPYTYQWATGQITQDLFNLLPDTYFVTVTGANGCSSVEVVTVEDDPINININGSTVANTSCVSGNGSISLNISPNNGVISWSTGATTPNLSNLPPGDYTVTVTVGVSCTQEEIFSIFDDSEEPSLSFEVVDAICTLPNGSIDLSVDGGVAPYTYQWSVGPTTQDLTNRLGGTYSVTVTTARGCTAIGEVILANNDPGITVIPTVFDNNSCSLPNGSILTDVVPEGYPYTYKWSTNSMQPNLTSVGAGTYTVTVTLGTCTTVETMTVITDAAPPNVSVTSVAANCGLSTGSASATASGGLSPYTYKWSNTSSSATINNVPPGTYTVTVTGANGCTRTASVTVANTPLALNLTASPVPNTSCVAGNGSIDLNVAPAGTYTYAWSNTGNTQDLTNLNQGTYTVTVTAGPTCSATAEFAVLQATSNPVIVANVTADICSQSIGAIDLTLSGGGGGYVYTWSNAQTTEDLSGINSGPYSVTVTASNGCTTTDAFTIANNSNTFSLSGTATALTKCNNNNGAADLTITPVGTYQIQWNTTATTEDLDNLPAGTYTVTVTQSGSCTASITFVVEDQRDYPSLNGSVTPEICGLSNGAIQVNTSNGTAPFNYLWNSAQVSEDLNNIPGGNYTVTVTDINGCTATLSEAVPNNPIVFSVNGTPTANTSCGVNNGGVALTIAPLGSYTFDWGNGINTQDLTNVDGGTYTVTVSAGGTCTTVSTYTVDDITLSPILANTVTPSLCAKANGGIALNVTGSTTPYQYFWSNSQTTSALTGILAGTYTVTVTGANSCTTEATITVPDDAFTPNITGSTVSNTSCFTPNGSVNIAVTPADTYTYSWNTGSVSDNLTNLSPGTYTVAVSAGGNCTATANFTVDAATLSPVVDQTVTNAFCAKANGGITLNVSGSTAPYQYFWNNSQTTPDLTNIPAGTYTVVVTDANFCTTETTITVPDDAFTPNVTGNATANNSCAAPNGTIAVSATPVDTYTFTWDNGSNGANLSNLVAGTYIVTVSAGGNCTTTASYTVDNNTVFPTLSELTAPSVCSQPTGSIDLTVNGGIGPFTYNWSNNQTTEDLTGILSGTYTVLVTGSNSCTATATYDISNESNNFAVAESITPNSSCTTGNGAINLTMTPAGAYTFVWSNSAQAEDVNGLGAGTYTVTITDAAGCAISQVFVLANDITPVALSGTKTDILCFGGQTGGININVDSGTPGYNFNWLPAQPNNPQNLNALAAGNYALTVTDSKGCTSVIAFALTQPGTPVALDCDQSQTVSQPGATDGEGTVTITGGTAPYDVTWSPGGSLSGLAAGPLEIPNLAEGSYGVSVTDANGCPVQCGFNIGLVDCNTELGTMSSNALSYCGPVCATATYNSSGQVLEPDDLFQYILHQGNSNQIVGELARNSQPTFCFDPNNMTYGTTYYISAVAGNSDGSGNVLLSDFCTVVTAGTPVVFREIPVLTTQTPLPLSCARDQVTLVSSSSLPNTAFQWSTDNGTFVGSTNQAQAVVSKDGLYQVIATVSGCKDTAAVQVLDITNQPIAEILADPGDILDCKVDQVVLSGNVEGTINPNIVWLANGFTYSNNQVVQIDAPGTYTFIVLDTLSACADTASITVNENQAYPPLTIAPPATLTCAQPTVILTGSSPFPGIALRWVQINGTDTLTVSNSANASVTQAGTYYLIGFDPVNTCTNIESTVVNANQALPLVDAGTPFNIDCYGEALPLNGSASGTSTDLVFQWSTTNGSIQSGGTTLTPIITLPGTYVLLVTDNGNGCKNSDPVVIPPDAPIAELDVTQPLCYGDKGRIEVLSVSGGAPPVQYALNGAPFTTKTEFINLSEGTYTLLVRDAQGCSAEVSTFIDEPEEFSISVIPDVLIEIADSFFIELTLSVPPNQVASIQWTPSTGLNCDTCLSTWAKPLRTSSYEIVAKNLVGCEDRAVIDVRVDTRLDIYVPNVFTPDGSDNNNLTIYADPSKGLKIKTFQIFSRWGEKVFERGNFEPNLPNLGWDGKMGNKSLTPAVFAWYAIILAPDGSEVLLEGDVTVVR